MNPGDIIKIHGQEVKVFLVDVERSMIETCTPVVVPDWRYTAYRFPIKLVTEDCGQCQGKLSVSYDEQTGYRTCSVCGAV